jgi:hypothetical protein
MDGPPNLIPWRQSPEVKKMSESEYSQRCILREIQFSKKSLDYYLDQDSCPPFPRESFLPADKDYGSEHFVEVLV